MKRFITITICALFATVALAHGYPTTYSNRAIPTNKTTTTTSNSATEYEYLITIRIHQGTFTLDPFEHIKNKINDVEITFPTTKEFYQSVRVDQELNKSFKAGSFIMDGDISHLKITVVKKDYRPKRRY